jgi:hypothetical protein
MSINRGKKEILPLGLVKLDKKSSFRYKKTSFIVILTLQSTKKNLFSIPEYRMDKTLVFHISEDGSEIELKHYTSSKTSVIKLSQKNNISCT